MCPLRDLETAVSAKFPDAIIVRQDFPSGACMLDIYAYGQIFVVEVPADKSWYGVSMVTELNSFTAPDEVVRTDVEAQERLIRIIEDNAP